MVCLAYSAMNTEKIRIISITGILIPNGYPAEISDECLFLYIQKGYIRSSEYMYMYIGGGSVSGKLMILVWPNLHPIILFKPIWLYIQPTCPLFLFCLVGWPADGQVDTESITFYLGHCNTKNFLDWTLKRSIRFFFRSIQRFVVP